MVKQSSHKRKSEGSIPSGSIIIKQMIPKYSKMDKCPHPNDPVSRNIEDGNEICTWCGEILNASR